MTDIYEEMMAAARNIAASFPLPRFYTDCASALAASKTLFLKNLSVRKCRRQVVHQLSENYGHGMDHAEKVALETGALVQIEGERLSLAPSTRRKTIILAQLAGLLHDLRRSEKNHARASARAAKAILEELATPPESQNWVAQAIANHEAFVPAKPLDSPIGQMISDALYDADKFRWGPDNFTCTLWQMLRSRRAPIGPLIPRFPKDIQEIAEVKKTFRTETGRIFGPEFIDLGIRMGIKIYALLMDRFPEER